MEDSLLYRKESYEIIGAAMEVHKVLGCGFAEPDSMHPKMVTIAAKGFITTAN